LRPLDLHALSTPPAFILSQDQTLNKKNFLRNFSTTGQKKKCSNFAHAKRGCEI